MNVFAKSSAGFNLTPSERALLKLVEALIAAGLVAAIPVALPLLSAQSIDWTQVLRTAVATFLFAVLAALLKYLTAQKDPPLGTAATPIVQAAIQAAMADIPKWIGAAPVVNAAPGAAANVVANDGSNNGPNNVASAPAPAAVGAPAAPAAPAAHASEPAVPAEATVSGWAGEPSFDVVPTVAAPDTIPADIAAPANAVAP